MNFERDPENVELRSPPPCPDWCNEPPGHEYLWMALSCNPVTGERWYSRSHLSAPLAVFENNPKQCLTVDLVAEEIVNLAGDTLTDPPQIALWLDDVLTLNADGARALADALRTAADLLDTV